MSRLPLRRIAPRLGLVLAIAAVWLAAGAAAGAAAVPRRFSIAAHDPLNRPPLPCDKTTTFGMESCINDQRLAVDRKIDATAAAILVAQRPFESVPGGRLTPAGAAGDLNAAQRTWFEFRKADCTARSDPFVDGTIVGVVAAGCFLDDSTSRLAALRRQLRSTRCGVSACKAAAGRRRLA